MSREPRRRERLHEASKSAAPEKPIDVVWAQPAPILGPGDCPHCGEHFGRAMRAHATRCPENPTNVLPQA